MSEWPESLVEKIATAIARSMPGWNDDTTEPSMPEGPLRDAAERHWEKVNQTCLEMGREYAIPALDALGLEEQRQCHMASGQWLTCHITDCENPKRTRHTLVTPWEDAS